MSIAEHPNCLYALIEKWNMSIVNLFFFGLSFLIIFLGILISHLGTKLPPAINQFFLFGKHCHTGRKNSLMSWLEVPKAWFPHFYIFAFIWSWWALYFVVQVSLLHNRPPEYVQTLLDYIAGGVKKREVLIDSTTALITTTLMCLQCSRRFYETNFVQIFSKKNKMNVSLYIIGYLHYFGVIIALLANAEGFVKDSTPSSINLSQMSYSQYLAIAIFLFCWWQQYQTNLIFVNLRKDNKTGQVATEKHLMPRGGFFEWVTSPHMLFEVLLYVILLLGFLIKSSTWWLVVLWVVSNQISVAVCTHSWYKTAFGNYPKNRKAIIPYIL